MSIKSLGLSLWSATGSRYGSSTTRRKDSLSGEPTPVGFGIPSPEDPDPFGVRALELAGLEIKEAGSNTRPSIDAFEYRPSPTSPVFRLSTQSTDLAGVFDSRRESRRNSKRNSKRSLLSIKADTASTSSQTNAGPASPPLLPPRPISSTSPTFTRQNLSPVAPGFPHDSGITRNFVATDAAKHSRSFSFQSISPQLPETIDEVIGEEDGKPTSQEEDDDDEEEEEEEGDEEDEDDDDDLMDLPDEEDIIIEEVSTSIVPAVPAVLALPTSAKVKVVSIKKKAPPALPLKNPLRHRQPFGTPASEDLSEDQDEQSSTYSLSPDKSSFDKGEPSPNPWSEQTSLQDNESVRFKEVRSGSFGFSDGDDASMRSPQFNTGIFSNPKDTESVLANNDFLLPSTKYDPSEVQKKNDIVAGPTPHEAADIVESISTQVESEEQSLSGCESDISGSTIAHTMDEKRKTSDLEHNLVHLIRQGLSEPSLEEDDYAHDTLDYYYHQENHTLGHEGNAISATHM